MFGRLFLLILAAAVATWFLRRLGSSGGGDTALGMPGFTVTFRGGRVTDSRGIVPRAAFLAFEDIAAHSNLDGEVGLSGGRSLTFSSSVPEGVRQQMQNAWFASQAR